MGGHRGSLECSVSSSQEELESFLSEKWLRPEESWNKLGTVLDPCVQIPCSISR